MPIAVPKSTTKELAISFFASLDLEVELGAAAAEPEVVAAEDFVEVVAIADAVKSFTPLGTGPTPADADAPTPTRPPSTCAGVPLNAFAAASKAANVLFPVVGALMAPTIPN